jgi:hypothetical protein
MMWILIAFGALGFLIGNIAGLTASSVSTSLLSLLFAFGGGSVIAFIHKLDQEHRRLAAQAIFALSVACFIGLYAGILVSEWQVLSPRNGKQTDSPRVSGGLVRGSIVSRKYLRTHMVDPAEAIDAQYKTGALTCEKAYEQLYGLVEKVHSKETENEKP